MLEITLPEQIFRETRDDREACAREENRNRNFKLKLDGLKREFQE